MIRRRNVYNALASAHEPRWLVSRSMYGRALEVRRLEPGTDLVRVFVAAMLELIDVGWQLGEFTSTAGHVRYASGAEQRMLTVESVDPASPERLGAHRGGQCTNCED